MLGLLLKREKEYEEEVYWLSKGADFGGGIAMVEFGLLYYYGHGVQKDAKALLWLKKSLTNDLVRKIDGEGIMKIISEIGGN